MSGERLSNLMHRSYWATYLVLACFFLLKQMIASKSKRTSWMNLLGAFVMAVFVVLSGAKVGLVILFIVIILVAISLFKRFDSRWVLPVTAAVLVLGIAAIFYLTPSIAERSISAVSAVSKPIESFDKENTESTTARIMLWDSSLELIKENFWWGVGTGDIKDELIQRNYENGYTGIAEKKLNSHNQFLNSHIAIGFFGSLFLMLSVVFNFLKFKSDELRDWRLGIIIILFVALLPESMLETQAGIIPYAFFLSFLTAFKPTPKH
jgi:O-antigen ligase